MRIIDNAVIFEQKDAAFVRKFGDEAAAEMVLDYRSVCPLPFIYDTNQLAACLGIGKGTLFRLVKNSDQSYRSMTLQKKNGGVRELHAPGAALKACQNQILRAIVSHLPVSPYAKAYIKGGTLYQNASAHVGKRYMLKLDIADFFGSIRFDQVYSAAFNTRYFPRQIGVMLTTLCCRKDVLPQGAPTSPALSNIVMRHFDYGVGRWCERRGISYTRYCDDMTFSSDKPLFVVYQKTKTMLEKIGFELNEKKTRFVSNANRQSVTGLTVNQKVAVSGDYKRRLRQEVYYALKFGLRESILRAGRTAFMQETGPDEGRYYQHLVGRLYFVLQIEPDNEWFQNALKQLRSIAPFHLESRI